MLIVFDIDGTLCDTCDVDEEYFLQATGDVLGVDLKAEDWAAAPHVTDAGIVEWLWCRHLGRCPTVEEVGRVVQRFVDLLLTAHATQPGRFQAIRGAARAVSELQSRGHQVVAATGGWEPAALIKLRAAQIPASILRASSSDSAERATVFRLAADRARAGGVRATRTVLVGDGPWDLRVAHQLGWSFVGIASGARAARLASAGAAVILTDFADLDAFERALKVSVKAADPGERP